MLPSDALYKKVATVKVNEREFPYPPFSMSISQKVEKGTKTVSTVKLYNPSPDTVAEFEKGTPDDPTLLTLSAGYENHNGNCLSGEVTSFTTTPEGGDHILEAVVADATSKFANALICKSYEDTKASDILKEIFDDVGIDLDTVELGEDIEYPKIIINRMSDALRNICEDTGSTYYFENGIINIVPADRDLTEVYKLSAETGLIGTPKKVKEGLKIDTLFLFDLTAGHFIELDSKNHKGNYEVLSGVKEFATFKNSFCTWVVKAV